MTFIGQRSRTLAIVAVVTVAAGAAIVVGRPRVVSEPLLGTEWQCVRTAFVLTTCSPSAVHVLPQFRRAKPLRAPSTRPLALLTRRTGIAGLPRSLYGGRSLHGVCGIELLDEDFLGLFRDGLNGAAGSASAQFLSSRSASWSGLV